MKGQRVIINADASQGVPVRDKSIQCGVTSPPYWGLRDYGLEPSSWPAVTYTPMAGAAPITVEAMQACLGLEPTPAAYTAHMVHVCRAVWRALRDDGVLWLNLGDSYATGAGQGKVPGGGGQGNRWQRDLSNTWQPNRLKIDGLKPKDLVGIPWRVAFALQADGWWLRSDVIWAKPNPMPESVRDRPTKAHEYVFLLTKSKRYYWDQEAVKEASVSDHPSGNGFKRDARLSYRDDDGARGNDDQWFMTPRRNPRTVWTITTKPCSLAHFATMPPNLAEKCIKAGTSERGCCPHCGAPWERVVATERTFESGSGKAGHLPIGKNGTSLQGGGATLDIRRGPCVHTITIGWRPTCDCPEHEPVPCLVFDPFSGAGTTGLVADRLGRRYVGMELSREYCGMSHERIFDDAPLFHAVAAS